MTDTGVSPFDVCGLLPSGVTVLEASAGTGKTFTIAALTARYVAAGIPLEHMLLVTFTRNATGELRDRVRERLVRAESRLAGVLAGAPAPDDDDDVLRNLAFGPPDELALRRRRLARALADFDAATIATTHGFCQHVLSGLGVAGDVERDVAFIDDLSPLVEEVVDDLYVRKFYRRGNPPFSLAEAQRIGRTVVDNPLAPIEPQGPNDDQPWTLRRRLAERVRIDVESRKRAAGVMTYDDLLTRLRSTLADPTRGPVACALLRARYHVALVDEFQDTDPVQWDIMRMAFAGGDSTLVLIGDPKQAIYSFRGADVYAYIEAAGVAGTQATLGINWRSDQGLIDAYDALFRGVKLGHEGISYRTVQAAPANQKARLVGAPVDAPMRLRVVHRADGLVKLTPQGYLTAAPGREHIAADLAADLVRLLSSAATIEVRQADGSTARREPVRPGHIAVLVQANRQAAVVRDALDQAGIPAVINGAGSVFGTPVARDWLRLLEALERPTSPGRAKTAALTVFLGWTAEQVAHADEREWEEVRIRLHRWAAVLRRRGVASLLEAVTLTERLPGRVLARENGERALTDLRHIGQLLHAEATSNALGATALTAWLRERITDAGGDTHNEDRSRRLESDAEAVQVLTIHRSKGLEFPLVYYPYLWEPGYVPPEAVPIFHDDAGRRTIDVGKGSLEYPHSREKYIAEERGEDLRLAYVALTRAQHQAVLWWAASSDTKDSSLSRLLFSQDGEGNVAMRGRGTPKDDAVTARFEALSAGVPGCVSVERCDGGDGQVWSGRRPSPGRLEAGSFARHLDPRWRRTSYSGITSGVHDARVASEPEETVISDEMPAPPSSAFGAVGGLRAASPGGDSPGGAPSGGASPGGDSSGGASPGGASPGGASPGGASPGGASSSGASSSGASSDGASPGGADEGVLRSVPSLLAATPGGADVGTFVHGVLEHTDFAAIDLDAEITLHVRQEQTRRHIDIGDPAAVVAGLRAALETPLGPLVGDVRLCDIGRTDRLDEVAFEMPLVGGDSPTGAVTVSDIGSLLRTHLPPGDILAGYADQLSDPILQTVLRGYLAGSIDLVLRTLDAGGVPRYAVIDYKTNRLAPDGEDLSAWHYRPAAMAEEMQRAHYPLQALLYTCALHRYLRWRLPGYDPRRNLAGVLYLFVRGMSGGGAPRIDGQPCGVFGWQPPAALVEALSDLLDRGTAAA